MSCSDRRLLLSIRLSPIQVEALEHVRRASGKQAASRVAIGQLLARAGLEAGLFEEAVSHIQAHAQVVLHFHPDRLNARGESVAEALLKEGVYRNQFETGLSNGGLTAFRGGDRDKWEKRLFGGAYQKAHVEAADRPKYGALDLMGYSDGAAPRFGCCYFRLSTEVSKRCSFTDKDSYFQPDVFGTIEHFTNIMASLLAAVEKEGEVLGQKGLTVAALLRRFSTISNQRVNYGTRYGRTLDDYVEAQVHGPIALQLDVERLVAEPSFEGTKTGDTLKALCAKYDIELDWHGGFQMHALDVPSAFRGPKIPLLAQRIAGNGIVTAATIGEAAVSLAQEPEQWHDWGTYRETLQHIKQLWHVLAYVGEPLVIGDW